MTIESEIVKWYLKNKRDLPWRKTKNPYKIWISEVILQQTRVNQAINYYYSFLESFPTVSDLAIASEQEVLKVWQGLGYYSRARNLHSSAKQIVNILNGNFPETYLELLKLKGVGTYTAAAVASFAYNEKVAVVDGNVFRVLSRLFAESAPINTTQGKKHFTELATELIDSQEPNIFNQAIMEFGAIHCTISKPDCPNCVVMHYCKAFKQKSVELYPVKNRLQRRRNRFLNYLFIKNDEFSYLKKRGDKDIWQGLYEFPLIETNSCLDLNSIMTTEEWIYFFKNSRLKNVEVSNKTKHQLTHQQLDIMFVGIDLEDISSRLEHLLKDFLKIPIDDLSRFPVPKPIENFINRL